MTKLFLQIVFATECNSIANVYYFNFCVKSLLSAFFCFPCKMNATGGREFSPKLEINFG